MKKIKENIEKSRVHKSIGIFENEPSSISCVPTEGNNVNNQETSFKRIKQDLSNILKLHTDRQMRDSELQSGAQAQFKNLSDRSTVPYSSALSCKRQLNDDFSAKASQSSCQAPNTQLQPPPQFSQAPLSKPRDAECSSLQN